MRLHAGLLQQLQPDLAAGGERRHRVAQALERHLADDRDRGRVQEIRDLAAGDRAADEYAAINRRGLLANAAMASSRGHACPSRHALS